MKLSDYKLQHMGWKGNMTYDEMVSHLNRIQPRKTIQNQKDNIEDEIKAITKRSRKSENNDECPNTSKGLEGSCNEDSRFISDDIREMRKIKCKLCGEIVLGYTFDGHLGWKHKVTRQEYGSLDYINNVSYYRSVRDGLELGILVIRINTNRNWNQTCDTFKKARG